MLQRLCNFFLLDTRFQPMDAIGICRNCVQLLTSTEVYSFSGHVYYVLYKRGLYTTATRAIKTINNYIVICFFPDEKAVS